MTQLTPLPHPARRSAVGRHEAEARARLHARARAERPPARRADDRASIPVSRREFWKLLAEFLGRGLTILMATPYLDEAERCTRVALLHDGHLLALDRPSTLQDMLRGQLLEVIAATPRPRRRCAGARDGRGGRAVVRRRRARPAPAGAPGRAVDALTAALRCRRDIDGDERAADRRRRSRTCSSS